MTVLLKIDHEKETLHLPVQIRGVYSIDARMLVRSGIPLPVRGVKVNDLSPLWPASHFRTAMLQGAAAWVSAMDKRGYHLLGAEGNITVYGPYRPHGWSAATATDGTFGANSDATADETDTADFLLYATFLAEQGRSALDDHEQLAAHAGAEYDHAMKMANNDVLRAMTLLSRDAQLPSQAARIAVDLVEERERRADPFHGRS